MTNDSWDKFMSFTIGFGVILLLAFSFALVFGLSETIYKDVKCAHPIMKADIDSICYDQEWVIRQRCLNFKDPVCATLNITERKR